MNTTRPPVVAIMGHIDHGKSTLLSYIRKSAMPTEAGGITQHISAYEVERKTTDGKDEKITFLDTPGHEAFSGHRVRGAAVADIAVLVVAADDGVKPQTIEALADIRESKTPFVIAFTKTDKPEANIDRAKTMLAEAGVYVEGFGGDVPWVAASGKTGQGVDELLDLISLSAEMESLSGDSSKGAEGIIIESNRDAKKGITAVAVITNGTLTKNTFAASSSPSGGAVAGVRAIENWKGVVVDTATFSSPVRIFGWDKIPAVGSTFQSFNSKAEADTYTLAYAAAKENPSGATHEKRNDVGIKTLPVILKADASGSLEALARQINSLRGGNLDNPARQIIPAIVQQGIGAITESDVRIAQAGEKAYIIGFNVKVDSQAKNLAERDGIEIVIFDIIYKLSEWLAEKLEERAPKVEIEEITGSAKVLKTFSRTKDKQIIGCRAEDGIIKSGEEVRIVRRENEIGRGRIREMQSQKLKISEIEAGKEFGTMIESKLEVMPGDHLQAVMVVKK